MKPKKFDTIEFHLSPEQIGKLNEWIVPVKQRASKVLAKRRALAKKNGKPSTTCSKKDEKSIANVGFTFSFTWNEIGEAVEVTELITGESIDLTEYETW